MLRTTDGTHLTCPVQLVIPLEIDQGGENVGDRLILFVYCTLCQGALRFFVLPLPDREQQGVGTKLSLCLFIVFNWRNPLQKTQ